MLLCIVGEDRTGAQQSANLSRLYHPTAGNLHETEGNRSALPVLYY